MLEEYRSYLATEFHLLLTNYMMLEYLLVRPADREALFANHRCRFVVLDEVHTYRGALGANIALLVRRLLAHLRHAKQDWNAGDRNDAVRFPAPVLVGTSATIKSIDESGRSKEEIEQLRNEAVQSFFSRLTGAAAASIRVIGEELRAVVGVRYDKLASRPSSTAASWRAATTPRCSKRRIASRSPPSSRCSRSGTGS